jgi:hypothetical protein
MADRSAPLAFLEQARTDRKLSERVLRAVERGGNVTAAEISEIAAEFGYTFTRAEFERDVRKAFADRIEAPESQTTRALRRPRRPRPKPPESSCAKGCLSYTINWHPENY